jgi:hypothetical protein
LIVIPATLQTASFPNRSATGKSARVSPRIGHRSLVPTPLL